jgi:hypothetical protein
MEARVMTKSSLIRQGAMSERMALVTTVVVVATMVLVVEIKA